MAPSDEDRKKRRARREERRRSRLEASLPPEVKSARLAPPAMRADRTAAAAAPEQASAADTERARTGVTASRSPTIGPLIIGVADGARPSGELGGGTVIRAESDTLPVKLLSVDTRSANAFGEKLGGDPSSE